MYEDVNSFNTRKMMEKEEEKETIPIFHVCRIELGMFPQQDTIEYLQGFNDLTGEAHFTNKVELAKCYTLDLAIQAAHNAIDRRIFLMRAA